MNIQLKTQGAPSASRSLAGKVSLVTGSTSGIGLESPARWPKLAQPWC